MKFKISDIAVLVLSLVLIIVGYDILHHLVVASETDSSNRIWLGVIAEATGGLLAGKLLGDYYQSRKR